MRCNSLAEGLEIAARMELDVQGGKQIHVITGHTATYMHHNAEDVCLYTEYMGEECIWYYDELEDMFKADALKLFVLEEISI